MKKLLFIYHSNNLKKNSGIINKIINQSKAMNENGILHKTYILFKEEELNDVNLFPKLDYVCFKPLSYYKNRNSKIMKLLTLRKIYKEYNNICESEKENYDFIYQRMAPLFPSNINFIRKNKGKIIFEHNSIEKSEYKSSGQKLYFIFSSLFDKYVRKCAIKYVCVSKEVFEYQESIYKNKEGIVIPNGIDVSTYKLRTPPTYDGSKLNLIFVGNIRYWHGLERIIQSTNNYKGPVDVKLMILGEANQEDYLKPLVEELKVEDKVQFLGYKTKEELDEYFDIAHIAIGCLGGFKKNMEYGSTLKNREYAARGIPMIISEIDDDLSQESNYFIMQVSNDENIFKMEDIIKFNESMYEKGIDNVTKYIREYANNNLDYNKKLIKLKNMIE